MKGARRSAGILVAGLVVLAGIGIAVDRVVGGEQDRAAASSSRTTTQVVRRDLIQRESLTGTLGFADGRDLVARRGGTLTWIADEGSTIRRGQSLYGIDAQAVRLLYGRSPAYRTLGIGVSDGPDVRQLETNLVAMGYDLYGTIEVDREFDYYTAAAIERWQEDLGQDDTGVLELGSYEFLSGPRRMGAQLIDVGALVAPGVELASTTSTERVVELALDADRRSLVRRGHRVRVQVPDGGRVSARISSVGKVAEPPSEAEGGDPTVEVLVSMEDDRGLGALDHAPVIVEIESARARDVLAVPVAALLALAEGGFALEVPIDEGSSLVPVEPGAHADGWVAVTGDDVVEGLEVVVPDGL